MPLVYYKDKYPIVDNTSFIAPTAYVTGDVIIQEKVTILFGASLRGDIYNISIAKESNVQDQAVLHTSVGISPCIIGERVTIGHGAIVHGAEVHNNALVGMGAVVLDKAIIEEGAIVAANALVPMGMVAPKNTIVAGVPAKVIGKVNELQKKQIEEGVDHYIAVGAEYKKHLG